MPHSVNSYRDSLLHKLENRGVSIGQGIIVHEKGILLAQYSCKKNAFVRKYSGMVKLPPTRMEKALCYEAERPCS